SVTAFSPRPADPKYWALPPRKVRRKRQKQWVLVGSTAASLSLLLTGYSNNNQGTSNYTNHAQANPVVTESDLEGLNDAERTILMTAAPGTRATGTLYILKTDRSDEKKLVIAIRGLKPSADHVYQVWKHEGNRVEAVGTVEPSEDGTAMFASRLSDTVPSTESPLPRKGAMQSVRWDGICLSPLCRRHGRRAPSKTNCIKP